MYVQVLDICIENIEKLENIGYFRYFRKYHDIFQPYGQSVNCIQSVSQTGDC